MGNSYTHPYKTKGNDEIDDRICQFNNIKIQATKTQKLSVCDYLCYLIGHLPISSESRKDTEPKLMPSSTDSGMFKFTFNFIFPSY